MATWARYLGIFVFGYLVYRICQEIEALAAQGVRAEDEIWVTFFWDLMFGRIDTPR